MDFERLLQIIIDKNPSHSDFLKTGGIEKIASSWHLYAAEIIRYFFKSRIKGADEYFCKGRNAESNKYKILQKKPGTILGILY